MEKLINFLVGFILMFSIGMFLSPTDNLVSKIVAGIVLGVAGGLGYAFGKKYVPKGKKTESDKQKHS